jgi:hypothetical protein
MEEDGSPWYTRAAQCLCARSSMAESDSFVLYDSKWDSKSVKSKYNARHRVLK